MTLSKRWYMYAYVISLTASIKFQKQIRDTSIISLFIKSKCNDLPGCANSHTYCRAVPQGDTVYQSKTENQLTCEVMHMKLNL